MALISSGCLHSMAAANCHMPAWPAPALAARPGRLPLVSLHQLIAFRSSLCSANSSMHVSCSRASQVMVTFMCRCRHGRKGSLPGPGSGRERERTHGRQARRKGLPGAAANGVQTGWSSGWRSRLHSPHPAQWPLDEHKAVSTAHMRSMSWLLGGISDDSAGVQCQAG